MSGGSSASRASNSKGAAAGRLVGRGARASAPNIAGAGARRALRRQRAAATRAPLRANAVTARAIAGGDLLLVALGGEAPLLDTVRDERGLDEHRRHARAEEHVEERALHAEVAHLAHARPDARGELALDDPRELCGTRPRSPSRRGR